MSLRPKKGRVAVSILRVNTPLIDLIIGKTQNIIQYLDVCSTVLIPHNT